MTVTSEYPAPTRNRATLDVVVGIAVWIALTTLFVLFLVIGKGEAAFRGPVDYDAVKELKNALTIPVIANGDINTPEDARFVQEFTGADGLMIGRGALSFPFIFGQIREYLCRRWQQRAAKPAR